MDRIFGEIKRAIEEEMANQEAGRRGPQPSGPSGRDAERYQAWLREEQERLRGGTATEETSDVEMFDGRPHRAPEARRSEDGQESQRSRRRQDEPIARVQQRARTTQHERSEARHQRRLESVYEQRGGRSDARRGVSNDLRSGHGVRKAILLSEIVGRPVSLRRQDEHLLS